MQMTCPKCQGEMRQYERGGVTVDQCTDCRGIFLDRGELERLIDAESSWYGAQQRQPDHAQPAYAPPRRDHDSGEYPQYGHDGKRRKRGGFLGELFD